MRHHRNFNKLPDNQFVNGKPNGLKNSPRRPVVNMNGGAMSYENTTPMNGYSMPPTQVVNGRYNQDYDAHKLVQPNPAPNMYMGKPLVPMPLKQSTTVATNPTP